MKHISYLILVVLLLPASVTALPLRVPSPANSDVDNCLVIEPDGGFVFRVIVRDIGGAVIPSATVTVDFCRCPEIQLCSLLGSENYIVTDGCVVAGVADTNGEIRLPIRGGGVCAYDGFVDVEIRANAVLLAIRSAASPDQDGNLLVDAADGAILNDKLLNDPSDPTGNLDCNETIDALDLAVHAAHLGNMCDQHTQAARETWGKVKAIYR